MSKREWKFYLDDMLTFSENVIVYCDGLNLETFVGSGLNYDATVRNLELIGEAANHIPEEIQDSIRMKFRGDSLLQRVIA